MTLTELGRRVQESPVGGLVARLRPDHWLPAPWNRLTALDLIFLVFAWITIAYFGFNVAEIAQGQGDFDFMPVTAGVMIVPFGWWAVRLRARARQAIEGLDDGAALSLPDESVLPKFLEDVARTVHRWQWLVGAAILCVIAAGLVYVMYLNNFFASMTDQKAQQAAVMSWNVPWAEAALLAGVMLAVAMVIGSVLGSLVGYGLLPHVMRRHEIFLAGLSTREARNAWRVLEGLFGFSVLATTVLCQWLSTWLIFWSLGIDAFGYGKVWYEMFACLWLIACSLFVMAGFVPGRDFQRRLDGLYGGVGARQALDQQIADAVRDRGEILVAVQAGKWRLRRDLVDLDRFLRAQQERQFRSLLLHRYVLYGALVCNVGSGVAAVAIRYWPTG